MSDVDHDKRYIAFASISTTLTFSKLLECNVVFEVYKIRTAVGMPYWNYIISLLLAIILLSNIMNTLYIYKCLLFAKISDRDL